MLMTIFQGRPDKISLEWPTNLLFNLIGVLIIMTCAALSYGFLTSKEWVVPLYGISLALWILFVTSLIMTTPIKSVLRHWIVNSCFVIFFLGVPISVAVHLFKSKRSSH